MRRTAIIFLIFLVSFSCKEEVKKDSKPLTINEPDTSIKFAKGIDIKHYADLTKIIIRSPYPKADQSFTYYLIPTKKTVPDSLMNKNVIRTPVKRIVATSTTHIPMIEIFHKENTLVGFPQNSYISSPRTLARAEKGFVKELGNTRDINTEILLDLKPDVVIGFSLSPNNKMYRNIEQMGIPVIYNGDWLEETPLGRAEWLKLFGALYGMNKEADSIFQNIENQYQKVRQLAKKADQYPTILSGILFKDKWNLPAGESFTARLFEDAHTNYLWKDTKGNGSLILSFESVFAKARNADFWIGSGIHTSFEEIKKSDPHYTAFKAFKTQNIYTFSKKRGKNGGVLYFELAPVQPHIVLMDLVKTTHPELLPNYKPFFLEKLDN